MKHCIHKYCQILSDYDIMYICHSKLETEQST